jgi:hypothetical protein
MIKCFLCMDVELQVVVIVGIIIRERIPTIRYRFLSKFRRETVWMMSAVQKYTMATVFTSVDYRKKDRQRFIALTVPNIFQDSSRK